MNRYFPVVTALAALSACAPVQQNPASTGAPRPTVSARSDSIRRPAPPLLFPGFIFDSAAYASAQQVPAFNPGPLITWGPLPDGEEHPERGRSYDLQHQVVNIWFDWARHAVVGTTTLKVAPLVKPLTRVNIDAAGMTIKKVSGKTGAALRYTYNGNQLAVTLPYQIDPGNTTEITIAYETVRPKKGAYFIDRKRVVWTQGETEETRHWIPTYDYPNDKTTWEMFVTTDSTERALSNGRLVGSKRVAGGRVQWHWSLERPASTYLMSVVAGNYTVLQDKHPTVSIGYWTYPDSVEAAWRGFRNTPKMIDVFERKIGVKYPWAKYDQSVVPDFVFGGMENVTATTQNDRSILYPAGSEPQADADPLVSHELAHQWFGDLLTTSNWAHIWLNEGFATFFESIYMEEARGWADGAVDRVNNQVEAIAADRRARRPLVYARWRQDPIEVFFSGHIYPKGASILQMLRRQLGDSVFWRGIKGYTTRFSFQSVVTDNLREEMERASGRDLKPFFAQWVYGAGVPAFRVSYSYDSSARSLALTATQVQPRDSLTGFFDADVDVEVLTDAGPVRGVMNVRGETSTLVLQLRGEPRSIRWDKGGWLLDVLDFPRSTAMLAHQLLQDDDVSGRMEALELLARRKGDTYATAAMSIAARDDAYWLVRRNAVRFLRDMLADRTHQGVRETMLTASRDKDARVRQAAAEMLGSYTGTDVVARLQDLSQNDPSQFVRTVARASYNKVK